VDPKHRRAYTGRSGQLAVMAELLDRGCNVAVPEVDVGRDVFAFQDEQAWVTQIQVKTAGKARALKAAGSYSAQVDIPLDQLERPDDPPLFYVFAIRRNGQWTDFLIISRFRLKRLRLRRGIGSAYTDQKTRRAYLKLTFSFREGDVTCSGESFRDCRNAWESLPPLRPSGEQTGPIPPGEPDASGAG
jgi:hypothetical protein